MSSAGEPNDTVDRRDSNYSPGSDTDTRALQEDQHGSPALADPEIDRSAVKTLPGTGGPDDEGDVQMPPKP